VLWNGHLARYFDKKPGFFSWKANCHNQPIAVAFDVENDTVVCNDAGITMWRLL
jgi:hypothetical protein